MVNDTQDATYIPTSAIALLRSVSFFACCVLITGGCGLLPHPIPLPPELQTGSDSYQVSGAMSAFQSTIRFGPYRVEHADTAGMGGDGTSAGPRNDYTTRDVYRQDVTFDFKSPTGAVFSASCRRDQVIVRQRYRSAHSVDLDSTRVLEKEDWVRCTLEQAGQAPLRIAVDGSSDGTAEGPHLKIKIGSVNMDGASVPMSTGGAAGFLLTDDDVLAQLEAFPRRVVVLSRAPPPPKRDELAAVCASLLVIKQMYD